MQHFLVRSPFDGVWLKQWLWYAKV